MPIIKLITKQDGVQSEDGHEIGWIVGWIEENKHPYFFVLNMNHRSAY